MNADNKAQASSGGIGFCGLLTIVFITLKLTGFINWSWWWVTAPLWGGVALVLGILLVVGIFALIFAVIEDRARAKRLRNWNTRK